MAVWSLTLRTECRLKILENRILTLVFGSKKGENAEWRGLHNEEHDSFAVHLIESGRLNLED